MMKKLCAMAATVAALMLASCGGGAGNGSLKLVDNKDVVVDDQFWSPRYMQWATVTASDVLNKFEGRNVADKQEGHMYSVVENFDSVAAGKRDIGKHAGFPWFDGLIYESIRGISDLLALHPNQEIEARLDDIIAHIETAQESEPDGFLNTYTQLVENSHRWGENGGLLRWMHDVYNSGMMVEAGVHYYNATGKTTMLRVATRQANLMCSYMGELPKHNVVPAHSGPEEAMVKLYRLYKDHPELASKVGLSVDADEYLRLAEFWIENRGHHCGLPLWGTWGNGEAEKWIKENHYAEEQYGEHSRPSFGDYAQDSIPVFEQCTIEGHAVRATLLMTGVVAAAIENHDTSYVSAGKRLWDNMVGRRMFVTGGVGAVHFDEKFGEDYFLPTDAYLETCAAVGAAFYSQKLNQLTADARYFDEFERSLYNNVLTGISLEGTKYTYQNPLNSDTHSRWEWHECPCCPPMFLKLVSVVPSFIYAYRGNDVYVNMFIGSRTSIPAKSGAVTITQSTDYPWHGHVKINVDCGVTRQMALHVRIPGWAQSVENPFGLYNSAVSSAVKLSVNGKAIAVNIVDGYAVINREWCADDVLEMELPMEPRVITANEQVKQLNGMCALACGPIIYSLEKTDNAEVASLAIDTTAPMSVRFEPNMLGGVNVIKGTGVADGKSAEFTAIPYFALGNRGHEPYRTWLPIKQ